MIPGAEFVFCRVSILGGGERRVVKLWLFAGGEGRRGSDSGRERRRGSGGGMEGLTVSSNTRQKKKKKQKKTTNLCITGGLP